MKVREIIAKIEELKKLYQIHDRISDDYKGIYKNIETESNKLKYNAKDKINELLDLEINR